MSMGLGLDGEVMGLANIYARLIYAELGTAERKCFDEARKEGRRYNEFGDGGVWLIIDFGECITLPGKEVLLPRELWYENRARKMANVLNADLFRKDKGQHNDLDEHHERTLEDEDADFREAYLTYLEKRHFGVMIFGHQGLDQARRPLRAALP